MCSYESYMSPDKQNEWINLIEFSSFDRETTFVYLAHRSPSKAGFYSKRKEIPSTWSKRFPFSIDAFQMRE